MVTDPDSTRWFRMYLLQHECFWIFMVGKGSSMKIVFENRVWSVFFFASSKIPREVQVNMKGSLCFICWRNKGIYLAFTKLVRYLDLRFLIICWGLCNLKWKKILLALQGKPSAFTATINTGEISITVFKSVNLLEDDTHGRQDCVISLSCCWNIFVSHHKLKDVGWRKEKESRKSPKMASRE